MDSYFTEQHAVATSAVFCFFLFVIENINFKN